jgi:hypothetical protein
MLFVGATAALTLTAQPAPARAFDDAKTSLAAYTKAKITPRPLCAYPNVARYTGQGSIDEAANLRCVSPGAQ